MWRSVSKPSFQSFTKELHIASKLNHENVIKLEGFMIERDYPSLITPWAEGGTLNEYIRKHRGCSLLPIVWLNFSGLSGINSNFIKACGIADVLAYLHGKDIVHADLKGVGTYFL